MGIAIDVGSVKRPISTHVGFAPLILLKNSDAWAIYSLASFNLNISLSSFNVNT